jgi:DNA-binding beta-propeller fold protein YncE
MKCFWVSVLILLSPKVFSQQAVPEIPFESVPNALKLPPDLNLGEASGVAVNSKGHIFVFTRSNSASGPAYGATAAQLLEFAPDGKFIREIGKGLYAWSFAHTVRIDKDDNVWCVDKGSNTIVRFNAEGHVTMVFGRKGEASDGAEPPPRGGPPPRHQNGRFNQPTDIGWNAAGDMFISDGYKNSRVAKIDKNGDWVKSWGERGNGPGQFNTPHSIAVDAKGEVYVGDRGNRRIQVFDGDGNFLRQFTIDVPVPADARTAFGDPPPSDNPAAGANLSQNAGAPDAICITPGPNQVMYVADLFPGRIYKLTLDGKVVGVLGKSGKQLGQFGWVHQLACPSENVVYAGELLNWRVQKLILHPDRPSKTTGGSH